MRPDGGAAPRAVGGASAGTPRLVGGTPPDAAAAAGTGCLRGEAGGGALATTAPEAGTDGEPFTSIDSLVIGGAADADAGAAFHSEPAFAAMGPFFWPLNAN